MRVAVLHSLPAPLLLISASIIAPAVALSDAPPPSAETTPSTNNSLVHTTYTTDGLTVEHTVELQCTRPTKKGDELYMHYRGTLQSDGSQFDSSYDRDTPFAFHLGKGQVIKGWDEGLVDMCVGEKRKLIVPPELGYGKHPVGPIPAGSTLIFETELLRVFGVKDADILGHPVVDPGTYEEEEADEQQGDSKTEDEDKEDSKTDDKEEGDSKTDNASSTEQAKPAETQPQPTASGTEEGPIIEAGVFAMEKNKCRLLGPFALFVQGALGLLALLSLVFKRWRERPRRPLKVWFFDVSKQIVGTFLLHLANLAMSEFSSGSFEVQGNEKEWADASKPDHNGRQPNPCSFYLLNLAIDTTVGIPVLIVLLKVLHVLFSRTPLANPPESIKSGHYGSPPRVSWWMKQSLIYFIGLLGMKVFVLFLFSVLPWLGWVGDWALRWTEGNEALQIAFVMFIFPVCMNAIQYYIIDGVIKGKGEGEDGGHRDREGFQRVAQDDSEDGSLRSSGRSLGSEDEEEGVVVVEETVDGSKVKRKVKAAEADLEEVNPTPLPAYDDGSGSDGADGEGSVRRK